MPWHVDKDFSPGKRLGCRGLREMEVNDDYIEIKQGVFRPADGLEQL